MFFLGHGVDRIVISSWYSHLGWNHACKCSHKDKREIKLRKEISNS